MVDRPIGGGIHRLGLFDQRPCRRIDGGFKGEEVGGSLVDFQLVERLLLLIEAIDEVLVGLDEGDDLLDGDLVAVGVEQSERLAPVGC